jgi:hypothetical protein
MKIKSIVDWAYLFFDFAVTFTFDMLLHSNILFSFVAEFGPTFILRLYNLLKGICGSIFITHSPKQKLALYYFPFK